jgi:hypothetical protein
MAAAGLPQVTVQLCLPNAPKSPKTFRKVFRVELDTAPHLVTAKAMSKLVAALDHGEAWAVCFWLKCKAGFQETSAHRLVDKAGEDRPPLPDFVREELSAAKPKTEDLAL